MLTFLIIMAFAFCFRILKMTDDFDIEAMLDAPYRQKSDDVSLAPRPRFPLLPFFYKLNKSVSGTFTIS